jgi:hypothetical protein
MVKRKIIFIVLLVVSLFIFRYFYNYSQYMASSSELYEEKSKCKSSSYGFTSVGYSLRPPKFEDNFEYGIATTKRVNIIQFFDLKYPTRYLIFNPSGKEYTFIAPFVCIKLKAGVTRINIFNNGGVEIIYPDNSLVIKEWSVTNFIENRFSDMILIFNKKEPKKSIFTKAMELKRERLISERFKLLSFFIYIPGIILLILYQKGFKVRLACIYFLIMSILHGNYTVESSMGFQLQTMSGHPKTFIFMLLMLLIKLYLLWLTYLGFKEIKKLSFFDAGFIAFYLLLPWILYF